MTILALQSRTARAAPSGSHRRFEGPAVLRLRMLEIEHALRLGGLDVDARLGAEATLAQLREAVLTRPALTFADIAARLRTREERA